MLTIGTIVFGPDFAIGKNPLTDPSWFHIIAGLLVFAVAIGGMVGIAKILADFSSIRDWVMTTVRSLRASAPRATTPSGLRPPPPPTDRSRKKTEEDY
jgi:succinate dehydrogenase/fumarate reductase cytochrome b subunit